MKELKQVEYPDIQLIAEGTGKILRLETEPIKRNLGQEERKTPKDRSQGQKKKISFKKAYRGISQTTKPLNGSHDSRRTQTRKTNEGKIKPAICHLR